MMEKLIEEVIKHMDHVWSGEADEDVTDELVRRLREMVVENKETMTRYDLTADACESLRARLAKYEDAEGNPKARPIVGVEVRPIAGCLRGQFETWAMETDHPVFGYIGSDWLDQGDNPNTYANDYIQGAWVMFQRLAPSHGEQVRAWVLSEKRLPIEWSEPDGVIEVQVSDGISVETAVFFKKAGRRGWKRVGINQVVFWQPLPPAPSAGSGD